MRRLLVVEDDADQRMLRRMILERRGYEVLEAATAEEGRLRAGSVDGVVMDLRLPRVEDGLALLRACQGRPVVVLSGWAEDLADRAEAALAAAILKKPVKTEMLLRTIARVIGVVALLVMMAAGAWAQRREYVFEGQGAEMVAEIEMTSPDGDWGRAGGEAPFAVVRVDQGDEVRVCVWGGARKKAYRVFLGDVAPGRHTLTVERDPRFSAAAHLTLGAARFESVRPGEARYRILAHAPVLLARENTLGKFSDVPLMVYATEGRDASGPWVEYTVIFSNEDGGTSTRDLMARWGRTTDIEYVYRAWFNAAGAVSKTLIQTKDHVDLPYDGVHLGRHPVLMPVTDNNMVAPAKLDASPIRYQFEPVLADLSKGSRELVMDADPILYEIAAREMEREKKLRAPATFDGEKISDSRNYLVVEMKLEVADTAVQALVQVKGEPRWRGSAVGVGKNFIERSGWARVALELPPGTKAADVTALGAECLSRRDLVRQPVSKHGFCTVAEFGRVFFLGDKFDARDAVKVQLPAGGWKLETGETRTIGVR